MIHIDRAYQEEACVHQLFEAQVKRTPDAVAVFDSHLTLTYRELNQQANQLAHHCRQLGVGPEVRVGVCLERSPLLIAAVLGVLKAGGAYVPLDPAYPQERLAFMLADSRAQVLLTQQSLLNSLPAAGAQARGGVDGRVCAVVCIDELQQTGAGLPSENPQVAVGADNLAYVIYTSGSTGVPKGVLGLHRGAVNRFQWMWRMDPFELGECCCQKTALSFVDSVWEIFGPLLQGIPLLILPDEVVKDPSRLMQTLATHRVTRIVLVPALLRALLETASRLACPLPDLKRCISSGEPLPADLVQLFWARLPQCMLLNLYGSSEVAADATWYDTGDWAGQPHVPIGQPIDNLHVYVLDEELRPAPTGVPGELYVGGPGLARGYLDRPDLTAERFVPNPFASLQDDAGRGGGVGTRLYKTGDRAQYMPDGSLAFLGRADHQVKIRGVRVELGEIEAALVQHPNVHAVATVARDDSQHEKQLVAYIVPEHEPVPSSGDLRRFLRQRLPEAAIPAIFVMLEALPHTPNGKVDRRGLPEPDQIESGAASPYVPPGTAIEQTLCQIWADVLGLKRVSIHDNFFDLGGYSLKATQVMSRVREAFYVDLPPLSSLFEAPTVAELSARVARQQLEHTDPATLEQLLAEVAQLSPDQARILLSAEKPFQRPNHHDPLTATPEGIQQ